MRFASLASLLAAITLALASSCSGGGLVGGGAKGKGETNQTPPGDSEKPTDNSEGVPGYLTDPESVEAAYAEGKIVVRGPQGSVKADGGVDVTKVQVIGWGAHASGDVAAQARSDAGVPAKKLVQAAVAEDGSFSLEFSTVLPQVVVTIGGHPGTPGLVQAAVGTEVVLRNLRSDGLLVRENPNPAAASAAVQLTAGSDHFCAVTGAGRLACWGRGVHGATGDGNCADQATSPKLVEVGAMPEGERAFLRVQAGSYHTCAINGNDQAWCFGYTSGAIGDGGQPGDASDSECAPLPRRVDVSALPEGDRKFKTLSSGSGRTCAMTASGRPVCWGENTYGAVGDGTTTGAKVPTAVVLTTVNGGSLNSVVTGTTATCGINSSGQLHCWGMDLNEELGNGTGGAPDLCEYAPGQTYPCAKTPRAIDDFHLGDQAVNLVVGGARSMFVRGVDGQWYCFGDNTGRKCGVADVPRFADPVKVVDAPGETAGYLKLASGDHHTCGVASSGKVYCWGMNDKGQLGSNAATDSTCGGKPCTATPRIVAMPWGETQATLDVAVGNSAACALSEGGEVACWGDDSYGQSGSGSSGASATPTLVKLPVE